MGAQYNDIGSIWKRRLSQLQNELSFCGLSSVVLDAS